MTLALLVLGLLACGPAPAPTWQDQLAAWRHPDPIPDFALVDHHGEPFGLGRYRDQHVLVGFVYTRCPVATACPLTVQRMRSTETLYVERAASLPALSFLALTLDPAHDTPERLATWGATHGLDSSRWALATGPEALMVEGLPSLFGVLALPRGEGDIDHTVKIALLGPGLHILEEWTDDAYEPEAALAKMELSP